MSIEELTTLANGENGMNETPENTTEWESVAALQDKMGKLREEDDPTRKDLMDFLDSMEVWNQSEEHTDEEGEEFDKRLDDFLRKVNSGEYWYDKELVGRMAEVSEVKPYELCEVGMPVEIVLETPEYYEGMVEDKSYRMPLHVVRMIHEAMVATPGGKEKFRRDLVEGKDYAGTFYYSTVLDGQYGEAEIGAMKALKESGASIAQFASDSESYGGHYASTISRESGTKFAELLWNNQLLDEKDVLPVFEAALEKPSNFCFGMVDVIVHLKDKIKMPEVDARSSDALYWYEVSRKSGKNELEIFAEKSRSAMSDKVEAETLQKEYDFRDLAVMRLFASKACRNSELETVEFFRDQKFLDALRIPENQAIIMEYIDISAGRGSFSFRDSKLPTLFLMLAQDREILEDMQDRGAFQNYPNCREKSDVIAKLADGNFTEKDRLSLFISSSYYSVSEEYYDEKGEPRWKLFDDFYNYAHDGEFGEIRFADVSPKIAPEYFLDEKEKKRLREMSEAYAIIEYGNNLYEPLASKYYTPIGIPKPELWQRLFECQKFDYIAKNIQHIPKVDFDGPARGFIENYYKYGFDELSLVDSEDIEKYFTETGPKQEFWQEIFRRGDLKFFSKMNPEIIKDLGLGDIETQFLAGITNWTSESGKWNGQINDGNIITALCKFIKMDADDWEYASEDELMIREAFERSDIKDMALNYLKSAYEDCISDDGEMSTRIGVRALYEYMVKHGGAGPLIQIETLLGFMGNIESVGEEGKTFTRMIEQKMGKNRWTNQEKSNFYAISTEIIQASPDLYLEFAELFANISDKKDFETFTTEIYPLYRAKLALLREYEDHSNGIGSGYTTISYGSVDMDKLKNQLHNALLPFNLQELSSIKRREGIDIVRGRIFGEISELFQDKFGFLSGAVPGEFSRADARAIEDMTLYLSNLNDPSETRRDLIGFYLAMQFGGDELWSKMRSGEEVAPGDYLNVASAFHVKEALNESHANNPINAENTGIGSEKRLQAFRAALQVEAMERRLGNIQTIDLKLQNLFGNVQDLTDPDLYPDEMDKERVALLGRYPVKRIGKAAAVLHQRLSGRELAYVEGEEEIAEAIIQIMNNNGIEITAGNVNTYFQKGLNGIKEPFNILANMERDEVPEKVRELQSMLMPPDNIVRIFSRLGEEFRPQSGVLAVSADLDYLEGLVSKQKDGLGESELSEIEEYIEGIRGKMVELNDIYDRAIQNYKKMQKSMHGEVSAGVVEKMREIDRIINGANDESVITTTCTANMPVIIENMRACLSCKTKGINNDTNLTFGEGYKFYLYSSNDISRDDSITDEIVYFVPSGDEETRRMSFVLDRVYGMRNIDIMINHIETVLNKAKGLKRQFPEVPISIIVPSSSLSSCGVRLDAAGLYDKMEDIADMSIADIKNMRVDIPKSGFGDHYIEFGDKDARQAGERRVDGIEIVLVKKWRREITSMWHRLFM